MLATTMRSPLVLAALLATASCATDGPDERPVTAEYIIPAILRPSCGTAACHSSATAREGLAFGTIDEGCDSAVSFSLNSYISGDGVDGVRMPLDSPLPQKDIDLINAWYADGLAGCDFP
jgi:hypothetical protein